MIHPIILCGGSGSRLWPLSCNKCPKQFLKVFTGNLSLFQIALSRFNSKLFGDPILITSTSYLDEVYKQAKEIELKRFTIIAEPQPMSTAPAIALAAFYLEKYFKNNIMLVLPSDSIIENLEIFLYYLKKSEEYIKHNKKLLLFGLKPTYPETGFGYIKAVSEDSKEIKKIMHFTEKPNIDLAKKYINDGYLWNSGIFMFLSDAYLSELSNLSPHIYNNCKESFVNALIKDNTIFVNEKSYIRCEEISIDYAVMEKSANTVVISVDNVKWNDIGSWKSIYDLSQKDENGNVFIGKVHALECANCFVYSPDVVTAISNVYNQVIINVDNKSLNISLDNTQKVKDLKKLLNKNMGSKKYNNLLEII